MGEGGREWRLRNGSTAHLRHSHCTPLQCPRCACFLQSTLNAFMALGRPAWHHVRVRLQALLALERERGDYPVDPALRNNEELKAQALIPLKNVKMLLPANVGDYTDFYSSRDHAYNVGVMIRGPANALQPNWSVEEGKKGRVKKRIR
jgi:hypothetical protein